MGISLSEFWDMTLKEFNALFKGYKLEMKRKDEEAWMQGYYNMLAFNTVLSKAFDKNSKAEYPAQSLMALNENKKLSPKEQVDKELMSAYVWVHQLKKSGLPPSPYD